MMYDYLVDYIKAENEYLHKLGAFGSMTILKYANQIKDIFETHGVTSYLDFGCGSGAAHLSGKMGEIIDVPVMLYDPYFSKHNHSLPDGLVFDAVVSIDVLEHIPEPQLEEVLSSMFDRASKCVVLSFCNRPAKKLFRNGTNCHVTQRPREWWEETIARYNTRALPVYLFETP